MTRTVAPPDTPFSAAGLGAEAPRPLADRLRPQKLAEVAGQEHIVGAKGVLTRLLVFGDKTGISTKANDAFSRILRREDLRLR